ncbi:Hint domain-containing protein [Celeribacter sp. PS-C1]|uniref:Hint domain-containing protein n=1 Tax=Celeribacter sp. PS-C1 TaxID=2820813 RepID=UPI001C672642|nr:Hint domain-containing protein [Celeribacter sp. PS-C1]
MSDGARIQCDRDGQSKAVEDLVTGDRVFDPVLKKSVEIVDILSRKIRFTEGDRALHAAFWPLRVGPCALGPHMPQEVVYVSPGQTVFSVAGTNSLKALEHCSALELAEQSFDIQTCVMHEVEYIALFTELPQIMNVNGLLLQSYSYVALYVSDAQCGLLRQRGGHSPWSAL